MKSSSISKLICSDPAKVDQVFKWILSGATENDVLEAIAQAWPDEKAKPLIVAAIDQLRKAAQFDPDLVLGFCFESTRDLYRRMVEIGDFPGALRAVKQLAELAAKGQ
jgi:hypothetical protein